MNISVLIPAFNEEKKIGEVVRKLKAQGYGDVVVIDDGSEDKTGIVAEKEGAKALYHVINRGQGAALKTGIKYCLRNGADIIVTFDADDQHSPEEISKLVEPIINGETEICIGSRFLKNTTNAPFVRRLFLRGGALLLSRMYKLNLTDSHNGLRAISKSAAEKINLTADRMEHASEILEQISKKNISYKEIPVTIRYTEYSLNHGQKSWDAFRILYRMLFRRLIR
ncbi:glycosyltransferase family 2 protein [Candidatus Woesearchaeota archaeon]|nr:glycosyltransferase family 2 protein [Candidatus Woesearchaeota archaeon]